jgi:hypothetical protein
MLNLQVVVVMGTLMIEEYLCKQETDKRYWIHPSVQETVNRNVLGNVILE